MNQRDAEAMAYELVQKWRDLEDGTMVEFAFEQLVHEVSELLRGTESILYCPNCGVVDNLPLYIEGSVRRSCSDCGVHYRIKVEKV